MPSHDDESSLLPPDNTPAAHFSDDTSWLRDGHLLSYPPCERARDRLHSLARTPQYRHSPHNPVSYFPEASVLAFLRSGQGEESVGKTVFFCQCARCSKQAGRRAGLQYRPWSPHLLGEFATIYALLIHLGYPALISVFRQESLKLDHYITSRDLTFLTVPSLDVLEPAQKDSICDRILHEQYRFRVVKFVQDNVVRKIREREILPIREKQIAAGQGNFGEVFEMTIDPGYMEGRLGDLKISRFARKVFKRLRSAEKEGIKEFVLQQITSDQFQHPNLMQALAAFEHGQDDFFILFEYAESTLEKMLGSSQPSLTGQNLWEQVEGLASGLAHLHNIPECNNQETFGQMVHRDLKPANILIVGNVMKIADFGFARWNPGTADTYSAAEEYSTYGAYNNYCPPLNGDASDKYDVYSFGAMISEIACLDLNGAPGVTSYRQNRYADEGSGTKTWRFHYHDQSDMKVSVAKEHEKLLLDVENCERHQVQSLSPWQQVFYKKELFDMFETMLRGCAADRPTAAHVKERLKYFNEIAHVNAANKAHQMQPDIVERWLETLIKVKAKTEDRFIARTPALDDWYAIWLYPDAGNEHVNMQIVQFSIGQDNLPYFIDKIKIINAVDRKSESAILRLKPLYLAAGNEHAFEVTLSEQGPVVYRFLRREDALRFQGVMTGHLVHGNHSLDIKGFSLLRRLPLRKVVLGQKQDILTGGSSTVQMWAQNSGTVPNISLVILLENKLHIIKIAAYSHEPKKRKANDEVLFTTACLKLVQWQSVDITDGIPLNLELQKFKHLDRVEIYFSVVKDAEMFWRNLADLQTKWFSQARHQGRDGAASSHVSPRPSPLSQDHQRRSSGATSASVGAGRSLSEDNEGRVNTQPAVL
ncbi:hypothetical protein Vi05172_g2 [Venturia inaequalis]|nr:hypothetical protein Vi05172_g2 [Venturia inaequalis]